MHMQPYRQVSLVRSHKNATKQRSKLVQQPSGLLCGDLNTITKVSRLPLQVRNWLVEQKDSALLISTSTTSECLLQVHWCFV